ncbi:MAG: hypothetical protein JST40_00275 [Armatimonadetes bacterium]|nr:hypothetical protein [Armatimonadota bacterium]
MRRTLSVVVAGVICANTWGQSGTLQEPKSSWAVWEVSEFLNPSPKPFRKLGARGVIQKTNAKPATPSIGSNEREEFESEEHEYENTEILKERWANRLAPDAYAMSGDLWNKSPINIVPGDGISSWKSLGNFVENPTSTKAYAGRMECVTFANDISQGAVVPYIGAVGGGIWKKVAITGYYVPVNDNLPASASIGAMAIDPNDSRRMIVGTGTENRFGGSGVYRTTNEGATWSRLTMPGGTQPNYCTRAVVDLNADGTGNTVLLSTDQGIFRTTNFGNTWTQVLTGVIDDLVKDQTAPNWWYATRQGQGIYLSANYGVTWNRVLDTTSLAIPRIRLAYSDADSVHVYALAFTAANTLSAIWHSKNYGQSWLPADNITFASDPIGAGQAFHTNFLFCDPTNADTLYFGVTTVAKITNARTAVGNTSTTAFDGGHTDYNDFVSDPTNSDIWILNDGGAFIYWKQFSTLFDSPSRFGLSCLQTVTDDQAMAESRTNFNRLIAGNQDNYTMRIDTGASQPFLRMGGADGGRVGINTDDGNWLYSSFGQYGGAVPFRQFFSTNGGTSFTDITDSGLTQWAQAMVPDPYPGYGKMVYSGNNSRVLRIDTSTGSPPFWTEFASEVAQTTPRSVRTTEVSYDGTEAAWITFNETSDVAFVTAGSNQARFFTCPIPWASASTRPLVDSDRWRAYYAYACSANNGGNAPQVFRTTDYGATWTNITGNMASILGVGRVFHVIAHPYSSKVLFAATEFGVLRSDNNGTTWYRDTIGMPTSTYTNGLRFSKASDGYVWLRVSTFGRGYYEKRMDATNDRPVRLKAVLELDPRNFQQVTVEFQPFYLGKSFTTTPTATNGVLDTIILVDPGKYRIRIKGLHHLAKAWENVDCMGTGTVTLNQLILPNGDIDNDNSITIFDYSVLSDYFDLNSSVSNWFTTGSNGAAPYQADLDGDDAVTVFDYIILSTNFDQTGVD